MPPHRLLKLLKLQDFRAGLSLTGRQAFPQGTGTPQQQVSDVGIGHAYNNSVRNSTIVKETVSTKNHAFSRAIIAELSITEPALKENNILAI